MVIADHCKQTLPRPKLTQAPLQRPFSPDSWELSLCSPEVITHLLCQTSGVHSWEQRIGSTLEREPQIQRVRGIGRKRIRLAVPLVSPGLLWRSLINHLRPILWQKKAAILMWLSSQLPSFSLVFFLGYFWLACFVNVVVFLRI